MERDALGFMGVMDGGEGKGGEIDDEEEEEEEEEEEDEEDESSSGLTNSSEGDEVHWITWFVSLKGNDYICEVEEEYIQDDFNLTGLSSMVPFYDYALVRAALRLCRACVASVSRHATH